MSKSTLNELIGVLKKEALEEAEQASQKIIADAEKLAQRTVLEAREKAEAIVRDAESEAKAYISSGKDSLRLASRDTVITVKNEIIRLLTSVLEKEVQETFDRNLWEQVVSQSLSNLGSNTRLEISSDVAEKLSDQLIVKLQASEQVSLRMDRVSGAESLRITKTDQGWSYDISPEMIARVLSDSLGPDWSDYLGEKNITS